MDLIDHLYTLGDPETQVLHYESGSSVCEVFVSGKQIVENGEVSSIDKQSIFDEAIEISERLKEMRKVLLTKLKKYIQISKVW